MKLDVLKLDGSKAGDMDLSDEIFGLEPREDILQRMVRYQLAKRQAGTHYAKKKHEIARTGKKIVRQKGSGGARHGSARVGIYRGGAKMFGPISRSHAHDLPKKIRALALKHALSAKVKGSNLIVIDDLVADTPKTKAMLDTFGKLGLSNALFISGEEVNDNFGLASRNIPNVDVLPIQGINVYDILRREKLVLSKAAAEALEARFK